MADLYLKELQDLLEIRDGVLVHRHADSADDMVVAIEINDTDAGVVEYSFTVEKIEEQ